MPKATRNRLANRQPIEVNSGIGSGNVPAGTRSRINTGGHPNPVISRTDYSNSGFAMLSKTFGQMAAQLEKQEDRAYQESREAERRAYYEAKEARQKAEKAEEDKLRAREDMAGADAGLAFQRATMEKEAAGGYTPDAFLADFQEARADLGDSPTLLSSFMRTTSAFASNFVVAQGKRLSQETTDKLYGGARQTQNSIYDSLGHLDAESFSKQHDDILNDLAVTGRPRTELEAELASNLASRYHRDAQTNPENAQKITEFADHWRKTLTSSQAQGILEAAFTQGESTVRKGLDDKEKRAEIEAVKQQNQLYSSMNLELLTQGNAEGAVQMRALWDANRDVFAAAVGEENATKLLAQTYSIEDFYRNRDTAKWQEQVRSSARIRSERMYMGYRNEHIPTDMIFDKAMTPDDQVGLARDLEVLAEARTAMLEPIVQQHLNDLAERAMKDARFQGGVMRDASGQAVFLPGVREEAYVHAIKAAHGAYEKVAPTDHAALLQVKAKVDAAVKKEANEMLTGDKLVGVAYTKPDGTAATTFPSVTGDNAVIDIENHPQQKELIEQRLFRRQSGHVRTADGDNVPIDWQFYQSLSPDAREGVANELIRQKGAEQKIADQKKYEVDFGWFWDAVDFVSNPENITPVQYEDGFHPRPPTVMIDLSAE